MNVTIQRAKGSTFIAKGPSKHWVVADSSEQFGGSEAASRPMELFLIALGSCTAMDVESLLKKMRVATEDFRVEITSDRSDVHPKVFTQIHLKYMFWGNNLNEALIKKAVDLSQNRYCPASAMLKKATQLSYTITINSV